MVFPTAFGSALFLAILGCLLLGVWTVTLRMTGRWRFELYYLDFALGVFAASLLTGFTLGTLGSEISFFDNLNICRKSSVGFLFAAGAVLNLGMMFLVGAIAVAGITVPSVIALSLAAAVSLIGLHLVNPIIRGPFVLAAVAVLSIGAFLAARAHMARLKQRDLEALQRAIAAGSKVKPARSSPWKGILLSLTAGLLIGIWTPMHAWLQGRDEITFGGYSVGFMTAIAVLLTTPFFSLFFVNLPVQGDPLSFSAYWRGNRRLHLLGAAGGALWYVGLLCYLLSNGVTSDAGFRQPAAFAIGRTSLVVAAAVGLFYAKDFTTAPSSARSVAMAALALCLVAMAVVAIAPVPAT